MAVKLLKSLSPPKAGVSLKKQAFAQPKAIQQVLKKVWRRPSHKNMEKFFSFLSVLVWLVNKVWCQLPSEQFRLRAVLL